MSEFLSSDELQELTGYSRVAEQESWLKDHGIPYLRNGKGLAVSRYLLRECMTGKEIVSSSSGPNWDALNA